MYYCVTCANKTNPAACEKCRSTLKKPVPSNWKPINDKAEPAKFDKQSSIYDIRQAGREFCQTEGSEHYKSSGKEPIERTIEAGYGEGFAAGNIEKYWERWKAKGNLEDLKKLADYVHILCGIKLMEGDK